jgi:hypothetical protein
MCTEVEVGGLMEDASYQAIPTNVSVHCLCHPTYKISEREREKEYTRKPLLSATT